MQFQPSEEQQLFLRALERFLDKEHDFERRRHTATTETAVDPAVWQGLADLGLFMLPFAEGVGGAGLGPVEFGPAMEILGSRLVVEPVLPAILLAGGVLAHAGSAAQRDRWLGPLIAGEARFALADVDAPGNFVRARRSADGWVLDGAKVLAEGAPGADGLIVSALDEAGVTHLFMVAPDAPGLSLKPVRTVDGARAADIAFQAVPVADAMVLSGDGRAALDAAHHFAAIAACWEAVGVMTAAYRQTADYVRQRQQFGRPLAAFQSVQHRVAEMAVACEEARAAAMLAAFHAADSANSGRTAAGACVKVAASADLVAKAAVQLHGGMGVSDELAIATAFRKLLAFAAGGGMSSQLERYAAQVVDGGRFADSVVLDLAGDAAFRNEVRGFLRERLTDEMCDGQALVSGVFPEPEVSRPWQQALAARGWLAPLWPAEHGGTGWTGVQRIIFETECALAGAPLVFPMGVRLVGSVIIAFGSEEQKRTYLPRIISDEDYWCQGFSEPGAGSDLASLSTRAVVDGDDYIVDGSKIWTTHAHHANRMFTLVRTSTGDRKQNGISFLVIDLDSPGVEIRPIISIGGEHDVNQVFLDGVRVPQANRIGEEGQGWTYAKYLLEFERGAGLFAGRLRSSLKRVGAVAAARAARGDDPLADPALRARFAATAIDVDVFEMLELKILGPLQPGDNPGPISSVLKLRASQLKQAVAELGVAVLGSDAIRWSDAPATIEEALLPDYLNSRAATIFGGAREVQLGIIASAIAGL